MSFKKTCQKAKTDPTLCQLAAAIREANAAGSPDRTVYRAFRDRFIEIGLTLPNEAYWSFLLWSLNAAAK